MFKYFIKVIFLSLVGIQISCSDDNLSSENRIVSFKLTKDTYTQDFNVSENSIEGTVESYIDLTGINLDILISDKSTITPNPNTITSITEPFTFTVTAENGNERIYTVSINRELSDAHSILEFKINTEYFSTLATIDSENGTIRQKIPEFIDLTNLDVSITISDKASLNIDESELFDFSLPISLIVTSESGLKKTYVIEIMHMDQNFSQTCDEMNASKWFGGDNRTTVPDILPFDRNVGTGQTLIFENDFSPTFFGIHLLNGFRYFEGDIPYNEILELKLNIKNVNGSILSTVNTIVPANFSGGFITFDLTNQYIFFEENTPYIFQWYLIDGELLGVTSSSPGNNDDALTGFCFNGGYSGQSKVSENSTLDDAGVWFEHSWNFNIKIDGKQ
tara:strand:+ start:318 stop:1490 length:1173 start_codon:yes stop_codon:yes gene_type:complete